MKRVWLVALAIVLVTGGTLVTGTAHGAPPRFAHLDPGGQPTLAERVPVNVVLVGYQPGQVDLSTLRAGLARSYEPVVISRGWYDAEEKLGIRYTYDYRIRRADAGYQNRLFGELKRLARPAALTAYQQEYNNQLANSRDVTANYEIPAPAVEKWLALNPPTGVDTRRNTVFLINWWGRSDFRHHVYTKTNEPDPDTGYNFGRERASRKLVAWGGTTARDEEDGLGSTRRVWFHDISAGPEAWAGSWNVDDADLDGDGEPDYRIPAIWEYGHYRPAAALSADLSRLVRYVALDLLFTTSPIYPVELPVAEPPRSINIDSNTYEGWPGVDASRTYIRPRLLVSELQELLRSNRLDYDNQDLPLTGDALACYQGYLTGELCYPDSGYPWFAGLYLQNTADLARTKDDGDSVDYELPIFNYATGTDDPVPLGFAEDNYVDGTQSYVFAFVNPGIVDAGYGLTTTLIHEVGHHVGLSHPHDGYDSESGTSISPTGPFYFAQAGDEVNSMMSYIDLNWDFSQFDHDNLTRFRTAAMVEAANRLAGEALEAPRPDRALAALRLADVAVGRAERAFARHGYAESLLWAQEAYRQARRGAEAAGVDVGASDARARRAQVAARQSAAVHEPGEIVDSLDGPRGAP